MKATGKIRINELARELEVKARAILQALPDLGIKDKKTHSSSLETDDADRVRELFRKRETQEAAEAPAAVEERAAPPQTMRPIAEKPKRAAHPSVPKTAPSPNIPSVGGGTPLRPPVGILRPPLRKTPLPTPAAAAAPKVTAPPGHPAPMPSSAAATPAALPTPPGEARKPAPPAVPGHAKPVQPIPSPQPGAARPARGPRAPLTSETAAAAAPAQPRRGVPGAPVRPPMVGGMPAAPLSRVARPVQRAAPGAGVAPVRARRGAVVPGQAPKKPVLVPGQPIYQRPRPQTTVPGMPQRPISRLGAPRPGHPAPGAPGHRPYDGRRGPRPAPGRTARDKEAEREQKFLKTQAAPPQPTAPPQALNREVTLSAGTTVKELAERLGLKANLVIKALVDRGVFATINQTLDMDLLKDLCKHFGASLTEVSYEEEAMQDVQLAEEVADLQKRAPVVTVMGHVDHGKTSLLDAIRESNVAEREAGGITQAIGAYHVQHKGQRIVFVDTPGHEAFTRMRARGAKVTDVVILVVAADDGVMPQTTEAIDHAKAAAVPIIVAINKVDLPNADPDRVKQQLADRGLLPEDWGGETVIVPVSAKARQNLDLLLEMVLLVADLGELRANPSRPAVGTVLEAKLDRGQGPVATLLVQNGSLRVGDYFLVGSVFGKVRAMIDDRGEKIQEAPPSSAVLVLGLEGLPAPGDVLQVATDIEKARKIVEFREDKAREQAMAKSSRLSLEQFQEQLRAGEVKELPIVLKTDVQGSTEVLTDALEKLSTEKVKVRLIHSGVGAISESDVLLATAANAIIIGFSVRPERSASTLAEREQIDIRLHTVIYELVDELKRAMAGLLEPVFKETFQGRADVLEVFRITKVGNVAGCVVQEGRVTRNSQVRLLRDNVVVHTGKVGSLRRFKDEASEARSGQECGIGLENFNDVKQGDVIEAFVTEQVAQEVLV